MRSFLSLSIVLFFAVICIAQPTRSISYETMLEVAEESLAANDYVNAIEWFDKAYKESKDKDLALNVAQLSFLIRDYEKAAKGYNRILSRDKNNEYKEDRIMFAKSLKAIGAYKESLEQYQLFMAETDSDEMKAVAENDVKGIMMLSDLEENISTVLDFLPKEINSASADFSPEKNADGSLYFASFARKKAIVIDGSEGDYYTKIFSVSKNDEGEYDKSTALESTINREGYHTSNPSFSNDGNRMYFTRSLLEGNEVIESRVYMSNKSDSGWDGAEELNINGEFQIKHPAVGELFGTEVLFFASDMEGGEGRFDIYYASHEGGGQYASPVNLGSVINTIEDEVSPYYNEGTLYFSSDGHPSMGGQDINYTSWNGSMWSAPINMGFVYNSSYDDIDFTLNKDGSGGFIVSNRIHKDKKRLKSKTCCDDIYEFSIREIIINLMAKVNDENDQPLTEANVDLIDITMDRDTTSKINLASNDFNFLLDSEHTYKAVITRDGYYPDSVEFNTVGIIDDYTVNKTIKLKPIPVVVKEEPKEVVEVVKRNEAIRLNNIYYDYDDDKILTDAEIDLNIILEVMTRYPDLVIELSSHTDSRGVSTYNQNLSQRRAESARNWLINKGIDGARIQPVGYGESVILNHCTNGVRCSDDEHRVNRRTEFKMLSGPETIEIIRG